MVPVFTVILFIVFSSFAVDKAEMLKEYVFRQVSEEGYTPVELTTIPAGKKDLLDRVDFDTVDCEIRSRSSMYLNLDCKLLKSERQVDSVKVAVRVRQHTPKPQHIEKNGKVNIVYLNRNIRIVTEGVALEKGSPGQQIRVKVVATGKVIRGVVMSANEVVVQEEQQ